MKDRLPELSVGRECDEHHVQKFQSFKRTESSPQWYDLSDNETLLQRNDNQITEEMDASAFKRILIVIHRIPKLKKPESKHDSFVANLREQIELIHEDVNKIHTSTRELAALHTKVLMAASKSADDNMKIAQLEEVVRASSKRAAKQIANVEKIERPDGVTQQRMLTLQLSHVRQLFIRAMEQHGSELERYARGLRQQVAKQISIATGEAFNAAQVEECIAEQKLEFFNDNYKYEENNARTALNEVIQRQTELAALEKSITEVRNMFVDMALLVEMQGYVVDNIEAHVMSAVDQTTEGRNQLKSAKKKKKSARKKKMILAGVGAAVATGLIAVAVL